MSPIEKKILAAILAILLLSLLVISWSYSQISANGGFKQLAIEAGKDMKDVKKAVSDYNPGQPAH